LPGVAAIGGVTATPDGLYRPPDPVPLAVPNAPGDLLWWDARFGYRHPVRLDDTASRAGPGTWVRVLLDAGPARREGRLRNDAADLRVVAWDELHWREMPRRVRPLLGTSGWEVVFQLREPELDGPEGSAGLAYHVYYGHPFAEPPSADLDVPETQLLLLELGERQDVEWGPEVVWQAGLPTVQTLVSADGRIVIQAQSEALRQETRVRLRIVPLSEKGGHGPLPDFELHADPPPQAPGPDNVVRWDPPLLVTINWAGLAVDPAYLASWTYFAYDSGRGLWQNVPVEFDAKRGVTRFTTDQM
jgi:hypothetical protein